jgi:hypothetical protein
MTISPARVTQVRQYIPELLAQGGTCLYVGASRTRWQLADDLKAAGYTLTLLEVWQPNCAFHRESGVFDDIIVGDVRMATWLCQGRAWDIAVWWHGPEHLAMDEAIVAINALESLVVRMVVLAVPWGAYEQNEQYGNPNEEHRSIWQKEHLAALGYHTNALPEDKRGNLLGWKRLNER